MSDREITSGGAGYFDWPRESTGEEVADAGADVGDAPGAPAES